MRDLPGLDWFISPPWLRKYGPLKLVPAPLLDRVGLHYFVVASSLGALMTGVFTLSAIVLRKTLGANEFQVAAFTALGAIALLIGIFGGEVVQDRDKRPLIWWVGLVSRGAFLLFLFCHSIWSFLLISAVFFLFNALLTPAVYALWQANVSAESRSRLWGHVAVVTTVLAMLVAYLSGVVLDHDPWSYRWLYAIGGVAGIAGVYILARSPVRGQYKLSPRLARPTFAQLVIQPVRGFTTLLRTDRRFLHFEAAFFLYGVAFMLLAPVMPIYMVDTAKMTYAQAGIATGLLGQLGVVFVSVTWGKMMDRLGPAKLCALIFAVLALFPAVLLWGSMFPKSVALLLWSVYVGHVIFGIGMSGINIAWSLGPVSFAGGRDASSYLGTHLTLTGLRGAIAPLLGALGFSLFGYRAVFVASLVFFLLGSAGMIHLARRLGHDKALAAAA